MNTDSVTFCHKSPYDNLPTTCPMSTCNPTNCVIQPSLTSNQTTTGYHISSLRSDTLIHPPEASHSPTISDLNRTNASPPEICSSPPIFEPPPLPHTLTAPPLLIPTNQPLTGEKPFIAPGVHLSAAPSGTITRTMQSTFPSPGSAFTELHPRNGPGLHSRGSSSYPVSENDEVEPVRMVAVPLIPLQKPSPLRHDAHLTMTHSSGGSSHSSSHSSAPSPIQYDALSSSASSVPSSTGAVVYCRLCGQSHDPTGSHRYNYTQAVDADLCCSLCHQPLVEPLDTKCGHTFCTPCLKSHLAVQALCPVDRQIINYLECQQASNIVKRLLDKLLVSCPHTHFCDTVLYRANLEEHIRDWCPGTLVPCKNAINGCSFEGPRATHQQHHWRCPFHPGPPALFQPISTAPSSGAAVNSSSVSRSSSSQPNTPHHRFAQFMPHVSPSVSGGGAPAHPSTSLFSLLSQPTLDRVRPSAFKPKLPEIEETYDSPTVYEGTPVSVVIRRSANCCDLGFTFVGGVDTPLSCILIQEIYLDGSVALDGRLRPGDQILEVNGQLVIEATHAETRRLLTYPTPLVQLTVYRETVNISARRSVLSRMQEEVFYVKLCKRPSKVLGIKLVGKKHLPGLYVLELVPGCEAELDGRLKKDDQILEINGIDLSGGTQEQAAHIINAATDWVNFKVSRRHRADTPDILRTTNGSEEKVHMLSPPLRSLHLNSMESSTTTTTAMFESITRPGVVDQSSRRVSHSRQSNPNQSSPLISSRPSDSSSSLHAFRVLPSTASISPSLSGSTEPFTVSKSTSQLLVDDDDRDSSTKEITVTTCSSNPPCTEAATIMEPVTPQFISSGDSPSQAAACPERRVIINKSPTEPLGISVAGGRHSQRGDTPIYITNISADSILGREKLVKRGDVLLEVNGIGLVGLTHNEAVDVIRRASSMRSRVDLRLIDAPETNEDLTNFMPSWTFWLQLPPICQLARIIRLARKTTPPYGRLEPLGFSIIGGLGDGETTGLCTFREQEHGLKSSSPQRPKLGGYTSLYPCPIVIKSIVPGFLAHRDGRLKCGDLILAVNNVSMLNVPHTTAVRLLKQLQGDVALQIISWPGTIV